MLYLPTICPTSLILKAYRPAPIDIIIITIILSVVLPTTISPYPTVAIVVKAQYKEVTYFSYRDTS